MPYQHLDDLTIADVAFKAWGKSIEVMFLAAAEALLSFMLENFQILRQVESVNIKLKEENLEMLLFNYLQEFIFYKDARQLLLKPISLAIKKAKNSFTLSGKLGGEKIDPARHLLYMDLKAVTLYRFKIDRNNNNWYTTIVLDV